MSGGTIVPRNECPGGQSCLGMNVRGDIFSRGTANPPTPGQMNMLPYTKKRGRGNFWLNRKMIRKRYIASILISPNFFAVTDAEMLVEPLIITTNLRMICTMQMLLLLIIKVH